MKNIDSIFDKSKYIAVQQNQIQLLKEVVKEKLTVGHLGGLFLINSELLNFLDLLERSGYDTAVINDMNDNPTEITNVKEFKKQDSGSNLLLDVLNEDEDEGFCASCHL